MRVILYSLLAVISLYSCQENSSKAPQFEGTAKNISDSTEVYLAKLGKNGSQVALDTSLVMDENFNFKLPDEDFSTLNVITLEGVNGNMLFINNQSTIEAEIYKDSLRKSDINGGKENQIFQDYMDHLYENRDEMTALKKGYSSYNLRKNKSKLAEARKKQQEIQDRDIEYRKKIIKNNPKSLASALVLSDMTRVNMISNREVKDLYGNLSEDVQRSLSGQEIQKTINQSNATEIGAKAPAFSAKTPEGDELSLKESLGEYTILDFWASWCKPCRKENPHLVKLYKKYHPKGLNMLSVSLDKKSQRNRWLNAIKIDNMNWQHVSNLQFWRGPIVKKYNVKSIPKTFILDAEGKIVATGLRGSALDRKLKELFGE